MRLVVDTNVLLRAIPTNDASNKPFTQAIISAAKNGYTLCITPQVLFEWWVVATRPVESNGFGYTLQMATDALKQIESRFVILGDTPDVYEHWKRLVVKYSVLGKQAHDARIIASMHAHQTFHLLTLNSDDFKRYEGIHLLHPFVP